MCCCIIKIVIEINKTNRRNYINSHNSLVSEQIANCHDNLTVLNCVSTKLQLTTGMILLIIVHIKLHVIKIYKI